MHPILAVKGRLLLYLVAWFPAGGLLAALLAFSGAFTWPEAFVFSMPVALVYAFVCLGAYYLCRAVPVGSTALLRLASTQLTAAGVSASLWVLAGRGWVELLVRWGIPPASSGSLSPFGPSPGESYARGAPVVFGVGVLLFLLASSLQYVILALEASRKAETQALEFKLLSRDAELKALRAQIHPHFLFNALNSISALTVSQPEQARRMCLLLGDLLRRSLTLGVKERISLADELALTESLLAIEKVRFGSRLEYEQRVEDSAQACLIPPLLLQPLVENAVTHGIADLLDGGTVRIEGRRGVSRLELVIENPRDPDSPPRRGAGVGLANVKGRLAALYGSEASVSVRAQDDSFRVELSLPAEAAGDEESEAQ
jgi:two-component system sensor histidine kinase AlgZ